MWLLHSRTLWMLSAVYFCSLYPVVSTRQRSSSYYTHWTEHNSPLMFPLAASVEGRLVRSEFWGCYYCQGGKDHIHICETDNRLMFINISRYAPAMPKAKLEKHLISSSKIRPFVRSRLFYSITALSWHLNRQGMVQRSCASHGKDELFPKLYSLLRSYIIH